MMTLVTIAAVLVILHFGLPWLGVLVGLMAGGFDGLRGWAGHVRERLEAMPAASRVPQPRPLTWRDVGQAAALIVAGVGALAVALTICTVVSNLTRSPEVVPVKTDVEYRAEADGRAMNFARIAESSEKVVAEAKARHIEYRVVEGHLVKFEQGKAPYIYSMPYDLEQH